MTILVFQQNLYSQKEIVGKVEYYISNNYDIPSFTASSEKTIKYLNSRRQQIELIQGNSITEIKTDTTGIFKINIKLDENLKITVNKKSKLLASEFQFSSNQLNDTLKLRITDEKIDIYKDSIASPKFYNMYNENQAYSDFENGKKRILTGAGFVSKESSIRRKKLSEEYGFEYEPIHGCIILSSESRIIYRYNKIMKKLIGIKNVW
ncbi:hypothetical protein ACGK9U_15190 [Mariniflexile sp. HNIBRBA6329]|uniref:hypothetical protein n=1 Tax=Mariniflexile sp. HNIBRBA6329 TaxID=3373088 RepID=UPI003744F6BB